MALGCTIFVTATKHLLVFAKINMTAKQGILRDHIYEGMNMAVKIKIFLMSLILLGYLQNQVYLPNNEYLSDQKCK